MSAPVTRSSLHSSDSACAAVPRESLRGIPKALERSRRTTDAAPTYSEVIYCNLMQCNVVRFDAVYCDGTKCKLVRFDAI